MTIRKRKVKTPLSKAKDRLWELCKQITRKKYGYSCYTCFAYTEYPHTGHFITDSTCSTEISYSLDNLRPQCYRCNIHLSGNWVAFESRMVIEHGQKFVDDLKKRNEQTKGGDYKLYWYEQKIIEYENILKSL